MQCAYDANLQKAEVNNIPKFKSMKVGFTYLVTAPSL